MAKGLFPEESLYDWLTNSPSGTSVQRRASMVCKEKCINSSRRRRRRNGLENTSKEGDGEENKSGYDASFDYRSRPFLQVSNRHYCRWINERILRDLAGPLDADDITSLFAPPPWGERSALTAFERITGAGDNAISDMAAWEPFRNNVDMDKEARLLHVQGKGVAAKDTAVMKAWKKVERNARIALIRHSESPVVKTFEEMILKFLRSDNCGEVLTLDVENKFHRLLLHGICEFYGLSSRTIAEREQADEGLLVATRTIIKRKQYQEFSENVRLVDLLKMMKNGMHKWEAVE